MKAKMKSPAGVYERLICDDRGFTTLGMAVALLLTVSLLFSSAQIYRINSASAEIQDVTDVAALAAQNEVGEFVTAVRVCDAVILSMSLLGVTVYGAGIVAMCAPATAQLSVKLTDYGHKIFEARDTFARNATANLNKLQGALPFFAAVSAARVAAANNQAGSLPADYHALAVLVPFEGEEIKLPALEASDKLEQDVAEKSEGIRDAAAEIEDLALQAADAKRRAFEADCGNNPDRCMYERAARLAGLDAASNPLFQSVDAWSFSVALERVRSYYAARLAQEQPSGSVKEQGNSALRKLYYAYAVDQMAEAYVHEDEDSFSAYLPQMPTNLQEMRATSLYDQAAFPVTGATSARLAHAWTGCPGASGYSALVSARQLEEGSFGQCSQCDFSLESLGKVAAASSSISNGFEFHYRKFAEATEEYERLRAQLDPISRETKQDLEALMGQCVETARSLKDVRLDVSPPGGIGVIAMVVNLEENSIGLGSGLVGEASLGARVAVSGATLLEEPAGSEGSAITALLDGLDQDSGGAIGAARTVLEGWSALLETYGSGQDGLRASIEVAFESVPIVGGSGLSDWASKKFKLLMESVGLQPADLDSPKPVLVNTAHIAAKGTDSFAVSFRSAQKAVLSGSSPRSDTFSILAAGVRSQGFAWIEEAEEEGFEIARIELPVEGASIPVTIELPDAAGDQARGVIESALGATGSAYAERSGVRSWE